MKREFYLEFYEVVEQVLKEYVQSKGLPSSVKTALFDGSYLLKDRYNEQRKSGISKNIASEYIRKALLPMCELNGSVLKAGKRKNLSSLLEGLERRIAFYIYDTRQLKYLLPILKSINRPTLLLCEPCVDGDIEVPNYVQAIELSLSIVAEDSDNILPNSLSKVRDYYTLFASIFECIEADGLVVLEGCHYQEQILGEIATDLDIPAIVIQQGWPSFIHSMFRDFPYSHFLTWGKGFNELWGMYNPKPKYIEVGYPCNTLGRNVTYWIAFFLQAPLFISDEAYFNEFIGLIDKTAEIYATTKILLREHPEYKLTPEMLGLLTRHKNIVIISDWPLEKAYRNSFIVVSHFPSSVMECMAYGCIPIVYDPTEDSIYNPDIKRLGLGEIAKTPDDFIKSIDRIFEWSTNFQSTICRDQYWFEFKGKDAINNTSIAINTIAPPKLAKGITKLNLGCGGNVMESWLNCDLYVSHPRVFQMDAGRNFPFQDETFELVFSEHMFEHLSVTQQTNMLKECHRILKPGGILRLAMPNMHFLMELYNHPENETNRKYIEWSFSHFVYPKYKIATSQDNRVIYIINNFMRDWGHQFIHTPESLVELCRQIGFVNPTFCRIGDSLHPQLSCLENHDSEIPEWANSLETFVLEITK